jgi:hypothetical protein
MFSLDDIRRVLEQGSSHPAYLDAAIHRRQDLAWPTPRERLP